MRPEQAPERFSEQQVRLVLRRAAELQAAKANDRTDGNDFSAEQVEAMAAELGIGGEHLKAALRDFDVFDAYRAQTKWLGAPPAHSVHRTVPGTLTDEIWQALAADMATTFGAETERVDQGPVRVWRQKHSLGWVELRASQQDGEVSLDLKAHIDDGISLSLVLSIVFLLMASVAVFDAMPYGWVVELGVCAVLWLVAWIWFRGAVSSWYIGDQKKMNRLASNLAGLVQTTPRAQLAEVVQPAEISQRLLSR